MSDDEALLRAISESPEEDIPRLMYADFLDESGEADRAAFVRAQVEAARQPPWEPFPVFCRHRKPEWTTGRPWASTLPTFPRGWNVEWGDPPFRRGFGWRVSVRSLFAWQEVSASLFETNPIGELHLNPAATLDDWRRFANAAWVRKLRVLKLDGANLSEPLRALRESPVPTAIEDVHLLRADSPGVAFIVSDLLQSRLGDTLRGLHLRMGDGSLAELFDLVPVHRFRLERLVLEHMGIDEVFIRDVISRYGLSRLTDLTLSDNQLGTSGLGALADGLTRQAASHLPGTIPLTSLGLGNIDLQSEGAEVFTHCEPLGGLRRLDLSRNKMRPRVTKILAASAPLAGLRSLKLSKCQIGDKGIRHLTRAKFWPNLVELDLRDNPITGVGAGHLLDAEVPRDLTALLLDGTNLGVNSRAFLRRKFGDAVIFTTN